MKFFISLIFISSLISCTNNPGPGVTRSSSKETIRNEAISIAVDYASNQLKDAKKTVTSGGLITISDKQRMFVINPKLILFGDINSDSIPDAIVSLDTFLGQYQTDSEHLILINTNGSLALNRVIESNMKVLEIKNGVILADVPTHSRNSPLFNCQACREVVKYQFLKGDLVKIE
jgi:hypothetical protein